MNGRRVEPVLTSLIQIRVRKVMTQRKKTEWREKIFKILDSLSNENIKEISVAKQALQAGEIVGGVRQERHVCCPTW